MSQLHGIQALRALAALMVAVHHVQYDAVAVGQRFGQIVSPSLLLPWMAGVDIFFVVSGFIMVHASARLFGRRGAARIFLARRLARIVPLYWAATSLFLLIGLLLPATLNSGAPNLTQIAASYLFWPAVSTVGLVQPVYSLGWTLNYEMLFYALFAAGLLLPAQLSLAFVTLMLVALVAAGALWGPLPLPFGFWGQPIVLEFAAGMGIAVLRRNGFWLGLPLRVAIACLGLIVLMVAAGLVDGDAPWTSALWRGGAAALLVLAAGCGAPDASAASSPVRALSALGDASYALYLVHPFVIRGLRELTLRLGLFGPSLFVVLALIGSVAAALIVHHRFEKPATRWLRRRLAA